MKRIIVAVLLILVLSVGLFLITVLVQPLLPPTTNTNLVLLVTIVAGVVAFLSSFNSVLDLVTRLSGETDQERFHVYVSHSNTDLTEVKQIVSNLRDKKLKVWIFDDSLVAGMEYEEEMTKAMANSGSLACFVGTRGVTQWQTRELEWAKQQRIPIIPVMLPGIPFSAISNEPLLRDRLGVSFNYVDDPTALTQLIDGIRKANR